MLKIKLVWNVYEKKLKQYFIHNIKSNMIFICIILNSKKSVSPSLEEIEIEMTSIFNTKLILHPWRLFTMFQNYMWNLFFDLTSWESTYNMELQKHNGLPGNSFNKIFNIFQCIALWPTHLQTLFANWSNPWKLGISFKGHL
jgi:hypothetical protein